MLGEDILVAGLALDRSVSLGGGGCWRGALITPEVGDVMIYVVCGF